MMMAACRVSDEAAVLVHRESCSIGVSHHRAFRSAGAATGDAGMVGCLGSFWLDAGDRVLGTPEGLLSRLASPVSAAAPAAGGVFCYAYCERDGQRLVLEAEKTGAYSLYYLPLPGRLVVATELRAFMAAGLHDGALDLEGIGEYLKLGHLASERTFFKGIKRLPMGCRLTWSEGRLEITQAWHYRLPRDRALDEDTLEQLADILQRNISRYATEPGSFTLTLSGGLDSRMLAASARDAGLDFTAVTVGPTRSLECRVAREVAGILGVPAVQHEYDGERAVNWLPSMVWLTEGRCPPAHIHYFDTMFSGEYPGGTQVHGMVGDAVLGGSNYYPDEPRREGREALRAGCRAIAMGGVNYWPDGLESIFSGELAQAMGRVPEVTADELLQRYADIAEGGGREAFRYWFRGSPLLGVGLSSQVLPWADIVCPFSDPELINLAGRVRGEDFFERNVQYRMTQRRWPAVTQVPRIVDGIAVSMAKYDPYEYDRKARVRRLWKQAGYYLCRATAGRVEVYDRTGFHDFARWYRRDGRLREMFADTVHSRSAAERGLWHAAGIRALMDGLRKGKSYWPAVAAVVFLEMYLQQLLGGRPRPIQAPSPPILAP